jgi:hypothetical protein
MKKILTFITVFFSLSQIVAQAFSGTIEFKYSTQKDTTLNIYTVKKQQVRLDQYGRKGKIEGSFIFNMASNEVKFLNPTRKLWGMQKSETPQIIRGECVVIKGVGQKTIAGYKCNEYTVKNAEENTVITYWVTESKFPFFLPMLKLWNGKQKQSIYYTQLKVPEGSMPLMSEERQLTDGKLLTHMEAVKITAGAPEDAVFAIPEGFTKFDQ